MSYPVLYLRIKAMLLDSVVLGVMFFALVLLAIAFEITSPVLNTAFIVVPIILFEPAMIWLTGGTIGHHYSAIRVVGKRCGQNLFILNGMVRFFTKALLGPVSLVAMLITKRHQAIHDFVSRSVVVFKNEAAASSRHKLKERETIYRNQKPSLGRRSILVVAYSLIALTILVLAMPFLVSGNCIDYGSCTEIENSRMGIASLIFLSAVLLVSILGFSSKLPGAYYRTTEDSQ